MVRKSVPSITEKNRSLTLETILHYELRANEMEIAMDEKCIGFIAHFQSEAISLRRAMMMSKMVKDLERIGDKAVNIVESAFYLRCKPLKKPFVDISRITEETLRILCDSINASVNENTELASDVLKRNTVVNELGDRILHELFVYIACQPTTIERSLHLLSVPRNLKKIADISTNICEEAVNIKEERVVKHGHL
jgi:phosphate transport system protein